MKKRTVWRKLILSMALCLSMAFGGLSATALANNETSQNKTAINQSADGNELTLNQVKNVDCAHGVTSFAFTPASTGKYLFTSDDVFADESTLQSNYTLSMYDAEDGSTKYLGWKFERQMDGVMHMVSDMLNAGTTYNFIVHNALDTSKNMNIMISDDLFKNYDKSNNLTIDGDAVSGTVKANGSVNNGKFFQCTIDEKTKVYFKNEFESDGRINMKLYDSDLTEINADGNLTNTYQGYQFIYKVLDPGTYYLWCEQWPNDGNTTDFNYKLSMYERNICPDITSVKVMENESNNVALSWKVSSDKPDATGYELYRCEEDSQDYTLIKKIEDVTVLNYVDTDTSTSKIYKYKMRTYINDGETVYYGVWSDEKTFRPSLAINSNMDITVNAGTNDDSITFIPQETKKYLIATNEVFAESLNWECGYSLYDLTGASDSALYIAYMKQMNGKMIMIPDKPLEAGHTYKLQIRNGLTISKTINVGVYDELYRYCEESDTLEIDGAEVSGTLKCNGKTRSSKFFKCVVTEKTKLVFKNKIASSDILGMKLYNLEGNSAGTIKSVTNLDANYQTGDIVVEPGTYYLSAENRYDKDYEYQISLSEKSISPDVTIHEAVGTGLKKIKIDWDKPVETPAASGYEIYRADSKDGTYQLLSTVENPDELTYEDVDSDSSELINNKEYWYKMRSYYQDGDKTYYGAWSSIVNGRSLQTKVNKISITGISKQIAAGKKISLKANISPVNATNKGVIWKSSNTKVATVSSSGVVSVKKKTGGKSVTITAIAKDGSGKKAIYKIKSMKGVVKKITLSGKKSVKAGSSLKLKAKVSASKGANKKLKWESNNTKFATVSSAGKVKTKKAGKGKTVKITVKSTDGSNKNKTIKIKIR